MKRATCLLLLAACSPSGVEETASYDQTETTAGDVTSMALDVSLEELSATASLRLAPSNAEEVVLEAGGLAIAAVRVGDEVAPWRLDEGKLRVPVDPRAHPEGVALDVNYGFEVQHSSDGLLAGGSTLLWPYHCGNLFPCVSNPGDGLTFELDVRGAPPGETTVFPASVGIDTPAYVVAWATGAYTEHSLGTTSAGTEVLVWYLPGGEQRALDGARDLVAMFDFLERRLGPYRFGARAGSVEANWGGGAYGGMEHHPYWHVAAGAMGDPTVHAHEAAHGWYGDGVRIACWEDFVLSEGTVSYLTARTIAEVSGEAASEAVWSSYRSQLDTAMGTGAMKRAWPDGCGEVDILDDRLFSSIPYMKGAFFYRALEQRIGAEALIDVLASFYAEHAGEAAGMRALLDAVRAETGYDPSACAESWLQQDAVPGDTACP